MIYIKIGIQMEKEQDKNTSFNFLYILIFYTF